MPDTKISGMTDGVTANATDRLAGARSPFGPTDNVYVTPNYIKTFIVTGGTVTTSTPILDMTQTWNSGGVTFTGLKLNVTDTASAAESMLLELQVGGAMKFRVRKSGQIYTEIGQISCPAGIQINSSNTNDLRGLSASAIFGQRFGFMSGVTDDTYLERDAANVIAQRNSTNAQTFRVYNTFTDASNYERGFTRWNSNVFEVGTEAAGTGTNRALSLVSGTGSITIPAGTVTTSQPALDITQTWNAGAVTFTGLKFNVTDTASATASLLMDLQVGGASKFSVSKGGLTTVSSAGISFLGPSTSSLLIRAYNNGTPACLHGLVAAGSTSGFAIDANFKTIEVNSDWSFSWFNGNPEAVGPDVRLFRDAAGVLAQRNGTSAQTFRIYNTYTDASNYERGVIQYNSNVLEIGHESAGTGTPRMVRFISNRTGADTHWEFISSGTTGPRIVIAGTDRSVTISPEFNMLCNVSGGFWSNAEYSTGATSVHALKSVNGNGTTNYFGLCGSAAGVMQLNTGGGRGSGYGAAMEMWEMTAPSAPATNGVRIYAEDNGSGKTRLMALFPTGAAQQIAIEP